MVNVRASCALASSLLPVLENNATRMNFFRFCELLELSAPGSPGLGTTDSPRFEPVRFRSCEHLGFPQQEIDVVYRHDALGGADGTDEGGGMPVPLEVRTTFLGLYGVDARMPSYFIDTVAQHREGAEELAAFLDMFHHRIVTQYYRVWRKYRYPIGYRPDGHDDVSRCLLSLAGLDTRSAALEKALDARGVIAMLGLLSQRTRTAEGLASVLQHALPDADIDVQECFSTWVSAEAYSEGWDEAEEEEEAASCTSGTSGIGGTAGALASSGAHGLAASALGDNCLLGRGCYDRSNTILVVMTPRSRNTMLGLVPGEIDHRQVLLLLSLYLGYTSNAHLRMHVRADLMPAPYLNSPHVRLGYTSQLISGLSGRRQIDPYASSDQRQTRVTLGTWTAGSHTLGTHDGRQEERIQRSSRMEQGEVIECEHV